MKTEHTPGPWHWEKARTQQHLHDATGNCFAQISMPRPETFIHPEDREKYEANAHLIAAAPMLLSVLKQSRIEHRTCEDNYYSCPASGDNPKYNENSYCDCEADLHNARIDAAIAKAKGGAA